MCTKLVNYWDKSIFGVFYVFRKSSVHPQEDLLYMRFSMLCFSCWNYNKGLYNVSKYKMLSSENKVHFYKCLILYMWLMKLIKVSSKKTCLLLSETSKCCEVWEKTNKMQQLSVYYQHFLNMFRASLCPSSGDQDVCCCMWCAALVLLDVVGSGCGALGCRVRALWRSLFEQ